MGMLRYLLATAVLLTHANAGFPNIPGNLAVSGFYVISGFYMQLLFAEKYQHGGTWAFYKSRAWRILPLYYLFLILSSPFVSAELRFVLNSDNWQSISFAVFENLFIFGQDFARFLRINPNGGLTFKGAGLMASSIPVLGQSWSLAVEFGFYLLAPLLLRRSTPSLLIVLAGSIGVRVLVACLDPNWRNFSNAWYAFLPSEIGTFLLGSLGYRWYAVNKHPKAGLLMLLAIVFYGSCYARLAATDELASYFGFVLLVAASVPSIFAWTRESKADRWIGELSYPIYLGHILVLTLLAKAGISSALAVLLASTFLAIALNILAASRQWIARRKTRQALKGVSVDADNAVGADVELLPHNSVR